MCQEYSPRKPNTFNDINTSSDSIHFKPSTLPLHVTQQIVLKLIGRIDTQDQNIAFQNGIDIGLGVDHGINGIQIATSKFKFTAHTVII